MTLRFSIPSVLDGRAVYAEFACPSARGFSARPDFADQFFRKFGHRMSFAREMGRRAVCELLRFGDMATAALRVHVAHVVGSRSGKEVAWINAAPVVAVVANVQTAWNRTKSPFVGNAVSQLLCVTWVQRDLDHSVSNSVCDAQPIPAIVRSSDSHLRPEPLFQWPSLSNHEIEDMGKVPMLQGGV